MSLTKKLSMESLEDRAVLSSMGVTTPANDHVCSNAPNNLNCVVIGDANLDGEYNTGDIIQAFSAGKFLTGADATWAEGDWNRDGVFDFADFEFAEAAGQFEVPADEAIRTFIPGFAADRQA